MIDPLVAEVRAIQESMLDAGRSDLFDSSGPHLRGIVRLTVEFHHFLKGEDLAGPTIDDKLGYLCESIFAGLDSFLRLHSAYSSMESPRATTLAAGAKSVESVREEFASKYIEFSSATDFEFRLRLLLDLFKLQMVFAALCY